jgi:EAL domain-containing protein (putative c-di-GMP-specific phosphodiesterase class I)
MVSTSENRLLVIDDQQELCEFIAEVARRLGFEALAVTETDDFRRAYLDFNPTVIVLDLQMAGSDGIELLRYLGSQGAKAQILVVSGMDQRVLSTADQVGRTQGLKMLGALQKPIMLADLENVLRKTIKQGSIITVADLEQALARNELQVYYQPKANRQADGHWLVEGVEALARWKHPTRGFIPPPQFITLAENSNLIRQLTERVVEISLKQVAQWHRQQLPLSVAINLSPRLLNDRSFPDLIEQASQQHGVDPRYVTLEVTESAAMSDPETTIDVLTRMRVKNFGLSIDDFGTGYSSLKHLYLMPFSELKIDISFVRDVCHTSEARVMVETMVMLAHKLGLTCCAEGVETPEILDFLTKSECDRAQGYLIGKPVSGEQLPGIVKSWNDSQSSAAQPSPAVG